MCIAFTPDCGYDNSTILLIGDVYCPNEKCLDKLCMQKKTFQSLGRCDYQCAQCATVCQGRNSPFQDQTNSFFLSLGQGFYIFEETPKFIQDVMGDMYCPGPIMFQQREMRISWRLCNNSQIHLWLWKVWSLVVCSQSSFYVKRARNDDRNRQKKVFFLLKKMKLVPNKQLLPDVPFQSTKYRKREFCVVNKGQETIGDVYCPTCRKETYLYNSTIKTTSFFDCIKCKVYCHVLNISFKDQKPTIMLFWRWRYTLF